MTLKNRRKTKQVRQQVVVDYLRRMIVGGEIAPGDRLPTHDEVKQKFHTTDMTVQRVFDRLTADGFIRTQPKIGRFVADRLPHLTRYALVFNNAPDEIFPLPWSRFDAAIVETSRSVAAQDGINFAIYHGVNGHPDSEGYQSLMRDIENQRLAGIIFTSVPFELQATPLMERTDPPRVVPASQDLTRMPIPGRGNDSKQFMYRALDAFEAGRQRRIAVITRPQFAWGFPDEFLAAIESRGMVNYPFWTQAVDPHETFWVRHAVHAILSAHPSRLPNALLITDDHLVEPVADALADLRVRVPDDLHVIGHWNFPLPYRARLPIDLLGFDAREMLRLWVGAIDAQRRGEKIAPYATIPARFSWELVGKEEKNLPPRAGQRVPGVMV